MYGVGLLHQRFGSSWNNEVRRYVVIHLRYLSGLISYSHEVIRVADS